MPVKFIQCNIQHAKEATAVLVQVINRNCINMALVQEPWTGADGKIKGLSAFRGDVYLGNAADKPRCCILASKGNKLMLLPQFLTRDLVAVKTNVGNREVVIASAYFAHDKEAPPDEVLRLVEHCEVHKFHLLLGCDANAHHHIWGSSDINSRGEALLEFLWKANLYTANRGGKPTFRNAIRQEVLDLTITSESIRNLILDWRVSNEESLSDHEHIIFMLADENPQQLRTYRSPRKTEWSTYREVLERKICEIELNEPASTAELDKRVEQITEAIIEAYQESCPLVTKPSRYATGWWNDRLEKLQKKARRLANRARRTQNESVHKIYTAVRNRYKKEIRKAKINSWKAFCEEISDLPAASRLQKALSKDRRIVEGALMKSNGEFTVTNEEALLELLKAHFPECTGIEPNEERTVTNIDAEEHAPMRISSDLITDSKIKEAISSFSDFKSPGVDGVFPALLKNGLEALTPLLNCIFKASLKFGYIPQIWREVKAVFIPKPGKSNYAITSAFRPISLSSFCLKTLERLVEWSVRGRLVQGKELHEAQHAYRPGRSTESALHKLISKLEHNRDNKEYALALFVDIEGAFSNVETTAVSKSLAMRGVGETEVRWLTNMLTHRRVRAERGDSESRVAVSRGLAQGGVCSPLMWSMVLDELLIELTDMGYFVVAYADDLVVVVQGLVISVLYELMQKALDKITRWCGKRKLGINPAKAKLMLFTNKRKPSDLPQIVLEGQELELCQSFKYLGVHLDGKLTWKIHVDAVVRRATAAFWTMRACFGKTWGLSPKIMRWMYITVIRPMITYGCVVWWRRCMLSTCQQLLSKTQRLMCISATGAIRTTPTAALEVIMNVPPLHIMIEGEAAQAIHRLKRTGVLNQAKGLPTKHTANKFMNDSELQMPCDYVCKTRICDLVNVKIPSREEWADKDVQKADNSITIFTDGSLKENRAGFGVFSEELQLEISRPLGELATVFQSEVLAIAEALEMCLDIGVSGKKITICSDSRAALGAMEKCTVQSGLVKETKALYNAVAKNNDILLEWVPGHSGVPGNEKADELARRGSEMKMCGPEPGVPLSVSRIKGRIHEMVMAESQKHWKGTPGMRHSKACLSNAKDKWTRELLALSRTGARSVTALLTGHGPFRKHLVKLGVDLTSTLCRFCEEEDESGWHILQECPAIWRQRLDNLGVALGGTGEMNLRPGAVYSFAKSICIM